MAIMVRNEQKKRKLNFFRLIINFKKKKMAGIRPEQQPEWMKKANDRAIQHVPPTVCLTKKPVITDAPAPVPVVADDSVAAAAAVVESNTEVEHDEPKCRVCLAGTVDGPLIKKGCGCRGSSGVAHLGCAITAAPYQKDDDGVVEGFIKCPTCRHNYSGPMELALAQAEVKWCLDLDPKDSQQEEVAKNNLAAAFYSNGLYYEALLNFYEILVNEKRKYGPFHKNTLRAEVNFAGALSRAGYSKKAERFCSDLMPKLIKEFGAKHYTTLSNTDTLLYCLMKHGRWAEAEGILREQLENQTLVLGAEHRDTLATRQNLVVCIYNLGEKADVMALDTLDTMRRSLGPEHPVTAEFLQDVNFMLSHHQ
jgi:hypothetical protein